MNKKKYLKIVLLFLGLCCTIIILSHAGTFLIIDDNPQKADAILVLSGDKGERTELAVKLYKEGYAGNIIFSGGTVYNKITMAELMKKHAIELGVPEERIIIESKADSTYENAIFTRDIVNKNSYKSIIVISSDYHMKRTKLIFNREFKKDDTSLIYCSSKSSYFNPNKWWSSNKSILITINEYIKLIGYWFGKNS